MLKNYFKTAWRNLWRNKAFSFINITGLALGTACSLLILLWVQDEYGIDSFYKQKDRLYVVYQREYADNQVSAGYATSALLGDELKKKMPDVALATGFTLDQNILLVGTKTLTKVGAFAGPDFFNLLGFPLVQGQATTALQEPRSIAVSKRLATLLFGSTAAAMGKTVRYSDKTDLAITAIFDDLPDNSSLQFDYVINWQLFREQHPGTKKWDNTGVQTFIRLSKEADPKRLDTRIRRFLDDYYKDQGPGLREELGLQRLDQRYLHDSLTDGRISGGRIGYIKIFSIIALFILLIACTNFMNLTTARSVKRAKEIGVRKVVGALRRSLISQFMGETFLLAFLSVGIALLLAELLLPSFNMLTGKHIVFPYRHPEFWLQVITLVFVTGFLSGIYPALYLSSFQPIKVLKGVMQSGNRAAAFRKGLVVFQFTLSILLIVGTLLVAKQLAYMRSLDLGYNRDNLAYISLQGEIQGKYSLLREETSKLPGVKQVTLMTNSPTGYFEYEDHIQWEGRPANFRPTFSLGYVGYDFTRTMGIHVLQGRDFSRDFPTDSNALMVNETAVHKLGFKDPIGKTLTLESGQKGLIVAVLKDFHFASLREEEDPVILGFNRQGEGNMLVRIEAGKTRQALSGLQQLYSRLNPRWPFSYKFSDEEYQKLYTGERIIEQLGNCFAALAILISCLGLFGLAMFTAEQRTREIGIRKVLGAGVARIFTLLSMEFLQLVFLAFIIASPLAAWAAHVWLEDYAYRTGISWWLFAAAGGLVGLIALATVSTLAMKAALANPVKSLKME